MARVKPFRALRFDPERAGPLDTLVAPPHDVVTPELRERLLAASPHNVIRLSRPDDPAEAGREFQAWQDEGVLVRETEPAVWILEETFEGPDGERRTRRGLVARLRVGPYGESGVYPHERTFPQQKRIRLDLLRMVRAKLSPVLFLHDGATPEHPTGEPDLEAVLDGVTSRLWRVSDPAAIERALALVEAPFVIADGHHRYETALQFHEEDGTEATAYILAVLVSRTDPGLEIFPTHRVVAGPVPALDGLAVTETDDPLAALARAPRDRPAFAVVTSDSAVLAEGEPAEGALDTDAVDALELKRVRYIPSAADAVAAVESGAANAAFLVRAPTVDQVEEFALAGRMMPQKSTYFFPKLTSGLLIAPFDE